jgi:CRP-like cAMP-binding protein
MKTDFFRRVPLFAGLTDGDYKSLEQVFVQKAYRKNQVIFREEETGGYMYIVVAGKVKVTKSTTDGKESLLAIHQTGDFFGEMSLIDGQTTSATVSAMEDCKILSINKPDFQHLLMKNEKIVQQIIQVLCARLRSVLTLIQTLSYDSADTRIRVGIHQLAKKHGLPDARGILINLKITHEELAEMVGTSRETVTRTLTKLQKNGIVKMDQRRIILTDVRRLLPTS